MMMMVVSLPISVGSVRGTVPSHDSKPHGFQQQRQTGGPVAFAAQIRFAVIIALVIVIAVIVIVVVVHGIILSPRGKPSVAVQDNDSSS